MSTQSWVRSFLEIRSLFFRKLFWPTTVQDKLTRISVAHSSYQCDGWVEAAESNAEEQHSSWKRELMNNEYSGYCRKTYRGVDREEAERWLGQGLSDLALHPGQAGRCGTSPSSALRARCPSRSSRPRSRVHPVAASKSFNRFPSRTPPSSAYLEELHAVLDGLLFGRFRGHREELLDCHCARREHFRVQTHVLKHTLFNERIFKQMVYNCRRKISNI